MNAINEKIDAFSIGQRDFSPIEIINAIRRTIKCMSWGSHAWRTIGKTKGFRFAVQGRHHKGHVYVVLAWDDTFTLYFTTRQGRILEIKQMIYIDQLVEVIDRKVEYVPIYKNN